MNNLGNVETTKPMEMGYQAEIELGTGSSEPIIIGTLVYTADSLQHAKDKLYQVINGNDGGIRLKPGSAIMPV